MLRLRLSSNFSFESFTVTWMCNTQEKGGKGIFINYIMYFLELFQGKYFRQIQPHLLYQMKYSSWMFSIKFTSPVIIFSKFLASEKIRKKSWKISPDFQNTMPNFGLRKIIKQNWAKNLNWHFCRTNAEYGWLQSLLGKKEFLVEMTQVYEGFKVSVHNSCGELSLFV